MRNQPDKLGYCQRQRFPAVGPRDPLPANSEFLGYLGHRLSSQVARKKRYHPFFAWYLSHVQRHLMGSLDKQISQRLCFVPLSKTGSELLFEVFSQRYERGSTLVTSNLPFDEWSEVFGSERLTGALLDRFTHRVHILEMNGESFRLKQSRQANQDKPTDSA